MIRIRTLSLHYHWFSHTLTQTLTRQRSKKTFDIYSPPLISNSYKNKLCFSIFMIQFSELILRNSKPYKPDVFKPLLKSGIPTHTLLNASILLISTNHVFTLKLQISTIFEVISFLCLSNFYQFTTKLLPFIIKQFLKFTFNISSSRLWIFSSFKTLSIVQH